MPLTALRLLKAIASLSPAIARELVHSFNLSHRAFLLLPSRPVPPHSSHPSHSSSSSSSSPHPPHLHRLRSAFVDLLLLFLSSPDPDVVSHTAQVPGLVQGVVKGLGKEEDEGVVRRVLIGGVMGVMRAKGVSEEVKVGLITVPMLDTLIRMWDGVGEGRNGGTEGVGEGGEGRYARVVEGFLRELVDWVREEHRWSVAHRDFSRWKWHRALLTRLLTSLHPSTSPAQRVLLLSVLSSFPSLLPSYLTHLSVSFEPRLSSRWVANMDLLAALLAVRLEPAHLRFLLSEATQASHVAHHVTSHLFPTALTRATLVQAVQHSEVGVRIVGCRTLSTLLSRYASLMSITDDAMLATDGWPAWRAEVVDTVRKRLPDVQLLFQQRMKIWPVVRAPVEGKLGEEEGKEGEGDGGKEEGMRASLYQAVLEALRAFDEHMPGAGGQGIDMWKLLLITPPSTQSTLTLLRLLRRCTNSSRMFHVPQTTLPKDDAAPSTPLRPVSYFGYLLALLVRSRGLGEGKECEAVRREVLELLVEVLVRTGSFGEGEGWLRSVREVVGWLESVGEDTVRYVEQLMGYVSSKVYAASAAATAESPLTPLLRAALSPSWPASISSSSAVIGLLCLVLSSLLSLSNPDRAAVASAIVHLPVVVAADDEARRSEAKEMDEQVEAVKVDRRNEVLAALVLDERFQALSAAASQLLGTAAKAQKAASKRRPVVSDQAFHRLCKLSTAQWKESVVELSQEVAADVSARQSLLLALAVNHKVPLLSLPRVQAALAARNERDEEDERLVSLVYSLPPGTLFSHASRQGVDLHFMADARTFTGLCEHWVEQVASESQRLLLVTDLIHHLLALLQSAPTAEESPASTAVVTLLATLHALVLSAPLTHTAQRLSAMLRCQHDGLHLIDFFLPAEDSKRALSDQVTRALSSLLVAVLNAGGEQLRGLVDGFLQRLVNACVSLAEPSAPPSSSSFPLPLEVLQELSPFLSREQLDRLSTAYVSSSSASADAGWWAVLCQHADLAQVLLSSRPAEAFHLLTRLSSAEVKVTAEQREAFDNLLLQLLQPQPFSAACATPAAASSLAYLVPELYFSAALRSPSVVRLRVVDQLLRSTASPVYVHLFAAHIHANVNRQSPRPLLLSLLPPLHSYVAATSYLPSSLLPAHHKRVISLLSDMLESFVLPALRRGEAEALQSAEEVESLVQAMLTADALKLKARRSMLQALLTAEEDGAEEEKRVSQHRRTKQALLTPATFAIATQLLSAPRADSGGSGEGDATAALSASATAFLLQALLTLTKLFKTPAGTDGFEEQLLSAVLQLLGDAVYLPTVTLPSHTPQSDQPAPSHATLSHHAPHLSYSALLASSSSAELSRLLTRCLTGALRSRFSSPFTHRLVFLLFNLQLRPDERGEVRQALSISPSTLFRSTAPAPPDLYPIDEPLDGLLTAHTLFDLLVSHSLFLPTFLPFPAAADEEAKTEAAAPPLQLALLHLLYLLFVFPTSPAPTPAPSSLLSLFSSTYGGSHTPVDLTLFLLFRLLAASSASLLTPRLRWGEAGKQEMRRLIAGEALPTAPRLDDDAQWLFTSFNHQRLQLGPIVAVSALHLTSSTSSPSSSSDTPSDVSTLLSSHYAAAFVLPFFLHLFKQSSSPDLKKLIDLGVLSYTVLSLSHPHVAVRKAAYRLLNRFYTAMTVLQAVDDAAATQLTAKADEQRTREAEADDAGKGGGRYHDPKRQRVMAVHATFKEQPELLFLLTTLKNSVTSQSMFVPAMVTAFVSRAVYVVMRPQHRLYRAVNRFVAMRPALVLDDVPMFYAMFSSGSALDWRMHRSWILRMMVDGCSRVQDWQLLRRRHVLPILMAFHDSRHADRYTRGIVIELIKRLACMGGKGEEALEGVDDGDGNAAGPLAAMVRRHSMFVWLRMMLTSEGLTLHTLRPAMELVLVLAREIHRRLPDEAPVWEAVEGKVDGMEVDVVEADEDEAAADADKRELNKGEDDGNGDADTGDQVDVDEEKIPVKGKRSSAPAADAVSSEEEEEEEEDEGSPADRAKAARQLSERRVAIAQDLQLLFSTLVRRTTAFVQQQQLIGSTPPSTPAQLEQRHEHEKPVKPQAEVDAEHAEGEKEEEKAPDEDTRLLSFGSSSSSSSAHVATVSQAVSLLHQLLLTSQKARKASGVDTDPSFPALSVLSNHSYLDLVLEPTTLSTFTQCAPLLPLSAQRDLFHAITKARTANQTEREDATDDDEAAQLLRVAGWAWKAAVDMEGGGRGVEQWLHWLHAALDVRPALASAVIASSSVSDLIRSTFSALRQSPLSPPAGDRGSILSAHERRLRSLNDLVLRLDRSLPASRQLLQRLSHAPLPPHLLARLTAESLGAGIGRAVAGSRADGAAGEEQVEVEEELALWLQDHWWAGEDESPGTVEHCAFFLSLRGGLAGEDGKQGGGRRAVA